MGNFKLPKMGKIQLPFTYERVRQGEHSNKHGNKLHQDSSDKQSELATKESVAIPQGVGY